MGIAELEEHGVEPRAVEVLRVEVVHGRDAHPAAAEHVGAVQSLEESQEHPPGPDMAVEGDVVAAHEEEDVVVPALAELAVRVLVADHPVDDAQPEGLGLLLQARAQGGTPSGTRSGEKEASGGTASP